MNILMDTQEAARKIQRGTIHLLVCDNCGFVFNGAFQTTHFYTQHYDNSQAHAPSFELYLHNLVQALVEEHRIQHCCIVEVGCGDGHFLHKLVEAGTGNTGYGFDPSYHGPAQALDGRLQFASCYYDETCCDLSADVLICRHVIEHIPDPLMFLRLLRRALARSPHARAFFETPTIEWILRNAVIWDVYYEHCSYFSADTITFALECCGFKVEHLKRTFQDQYLWIEASVVDTEMPTTTMMQPSFMRSLALHFQQEEQQFCQRWRQTLEALKEDGPIAVLGAAGKGVTLANLIDPEAQLISCIVDLNPHKQGKFLPGTGHPIVSYEGMKTYDVMSALLLNPNYYEDTLRLLAHHKVQHIRLITA